MFWICPPGYRARRGDACFGRALSTARPRKDLPRDVNEAIFANVYDRAASAVTREQDRIRFAAANRSRDLWFNFGIKNQLISLVAVSREATAPQVSAALGEVTGVIRRQAGPATRMSGGGDAQSMGAGLLRQASSEFAFANYYACARATNMGQDFMLTEEYRSLPN